MLSVSQPTGIDTHNDCITVTVRAEKYHFSILLALPKCQGIQGASVSRECIPPGMRLHLRRNQFEARGMALYKGNWDGTLCIHVEGRLVKKQLKFVVR